MKTVGEFKKAGLEFVRGDKCYKNGIDGDEFHRHWHEASGMYSDQVVSEFAWRENTGVKPEFSGNVDLVIGDIGHGFSQRGCVGGNNIINWELNCPTQVVKWRPSLNQSSAIEPDTKESAIHKAWVALSGKVKAISGQWKTLWHVKDGYYINGEYYHSFNDKCEEAGAKFICTKREFTDYCEKMAAEEKRMDIIGQNGNDGLHYDNAAQQVEALAVNRPSEKMKFALDEVDEISAKVINDKPIFTQAMADAYKMPAIGSWFTLHYHEHGSRFNDMDGHDFEVIGINDDIYTFRNDIKGYGALKLNTINCTPIDTRTDREKAIDEMLELDLWATDREFLEAIYDAGYRKC